MSYLRLIAVPLVLISSVANSAGIESTLSLCAKTALAERVSNKTEVKFDTESPYRNRQVSNESFQLEVADGKSGEPLGVISCSVNRSGKIVSSELRPSAGPIAAN